MTRFTRFSIYFAVFAQILALSFMLILGFEVVNSDGMPGLAIGGIFFIFTVATLGLLTVALIRDRKRP